MAKRIILLEKTGQRTYRFALWADVPVARRPYYANVDAISAYLDASVAEVDAIKAGAVRELVDTLSGENLTLAQVQALLIARWTAFQNEITNYNPWDRYGSIWDGTSWTAGGVA